MTAHSLSVVDPQRVAQDPMALRQVFSTVDVASCPHTFNFHMHTRCSDGQLHPQDLVDQAIAIGLEGFTITDHHTVKGYQIAQDYLRVLSTGEPVSTPLPQLWIGIEITAQLLGTEVHILGYAFDINHPAMQIYSQGREPTGETALAANVIAALHQAGGLAVLAHPARYRRSPQDLIPVAATLGIDGVETYYAYGNPNPWHPSPKQTQQVKQLSQTYALLNTCGTDTHGSSLLQRL